jgi:choline dehydrogenase-like flavoprotein
LKPAVSGALNTAGMVEVRAQCMVRRVLSDSDNTQASHAPKVTGCEYIDREGAVQSVYAHTVVLACSAVETARLLLLSANDRFPQGLANSSGKVGRHLQFHGVTMGWAEWHNGANSSAVEAALSNANSPFIGRSLYDFYHLPANIAPIGHGGILRFSRASPEPITDAQALALSSGNPRWGDRLVADLQHFYRRSYRMAYEVFHGFIANADTHVSLDPDATDHYGLPSARISLAVDPHQRACGNYIAQQAEAIFKTMGANNIGRSVSGGTTWHLAHGTCRASHDPHQGVVNAQGQSHDIANLFVADASYMPSNGAAPPTLTIIANALRISDYICSDDYKEKRDK